MFGITYLPEKELARQLALQDELMSCRDPKRIPEIHREIAEIEAKRKPIIECNIEETTELKAFLYKKLQLTMKGGKRTQAIRFQEMIKLLDDRLLVLNLEMRKESLEKAEKIAKAKEEREEEAKEVTRGIEEGERPPKRRSSKSRWTTGFSDID